MTASTSDVALDPASPPEGSSDSYASATSASQGSGAAEDLRGIFDHFDENKDGKISREELSSSLQRLGLEVASAELADMIDSVDANKDGFVNYEEFVGLYKNLEKGGGGDDVEEEEVDEADVELRQAFEVFDKDGDGLITAQELHSVLKSMGVLKGRTLADCTAMIRRVDSDGNGQVDFEEFKQMMSPSSSVIG
eukprot:c14329_g1_i1 orf=215-796(-)